MEESDFDFKKVGPTAVLQIPFDKRDLVANGVPLSVYAFHDSGSAKPPCRFRFRITRRANRLPLSFQIKSK